MTRVRTAEAARMTGLDPRTIQEKARQWAIAIYDLVQKVNEGAK